MAVGRASGPAPLVGGLSPTRPHFMVSPSLTVGKTLMNSFQLITDLFIHAGAKGQGGVPQVVVTGFVHQFCVVHCCDFLSYKG